MNYKFATISLFTLIFAYLAISVLSGQYHKVLANRSPFPWPEARADLRKYYGLQKDKAFAASVSLSAWGWSHGQPNRRNAERLAVEHCERSGEPCQLYAFGNEVVWDSDLARRNSYATVSSQALHGAVWRFHGETNPHGVTLVMPPDAPSIVSDYRSSRGIMGRLRARYRGSAGHKGIDIIAPKGSLVLAAADGEVLTSNNSRMAGLSVRIAHRGPEDEIVTTYIHLDESFVEAGDTIVRGQAIGTVGISGEGANAARPHLHFETYGSNPHLHWYDGQGRVTCFEPTRTYAQEQTRLTYPMPCGLAEAGVRVAN